MSLRFIRKSVASLLTVCALCSTLVFLPACGKTGGEEQGDTPDTTYDMENLVAHDTVTVPKQKWGVNAFKVSSTRPDIASAVLNEDGSVTLTSYNPGKADILVSDCFDHSAIIHLTIDKDKNRTITYEWEKCGEKFIDARNYGCIPNTDFDCAPALQRAIDKAAKTGETVFLFPGIYHVSFIHIKSGVTLRMYSGEFDAKDGYTDELAEAVNNGTITVLKQCRIMNNEVGGIAHDGDTDFNVVGGVFDNEGSSKTILLFGLSKNINVENVIFKDIKCNHVIQITGCENVSVKNCVFAGFIDDGTFTREMLQIEPGGPGAHGGNTQVFNEGEFETDKNITIENCYFGPSDEEGPPLMGIGHHGQGTGKFNADGVVIRDCVFDGCMYAGIRTSDFSNTLITGCTFKTDSKFSNPYYKEQKTPAHIVFYSYDRDHTYKTVVDGKTTITDALAKELKGTQNLTVSNNKFVLTAGTDKRVIDVQGTKYTPGLFFGGPVNRQDTYDGKIYRQTGYFLTCDYIGNVAFTDNEIVIEGQTSYKDYALYFKNVIGLKIENNTVNAADGVAYTYSDDGFAGLFKLKCTSGSDAETKILTLASHPTAITFNAQNGKTFPVVGGAACDLTLKVSGSGTIAVSSETGKDAKVTAIPEEGYVFKGWFDGDKPIDTEFKVSAAKTLTAKFDKQ